MKCDDGGMADRFRPGAGDLLISSPLIDGPEFSRTIVLLLNVDDDGALGVIINRPSEVGIEVVLDRWTDLVSPPAVLFSGGPVEPDGAVCVARLAAGAEAPQGWRAMFGSLGLVDLDEPVSGSFDAVRIYAGYAGWGADQLESELAEGAWFVVPSEPADLVSTDPESLWRSVLRRQSVPVSYLATMPVDPTRN